VWPDVRHSFELIPGKRGRTRSVNRGTAVACYNMPKVSQQANLQRG